MPLDDAQRSASAKALFMDAAKTTTGLDGVAEKAAAKVADTAEAAVAAGSSIFDVFRSKSPAKKYGKSPSRTHSS